MIVINNAKVGIIQDSSQVATHILHHQNKESNICHFSKLVAAGLEFFVCSNYASKGKVSLLQKTD